MERPPARGRVLIVDDEEPFAGRLADELALAGYEVEAVRTLAAARASLRERPPPLVLLDPDLPDGDGLALLEDAHGECAPAVVLVTTRAEPASVVRAVRLGARDVVAKPCRPGEVRAAIEALAGAAPAPARRPAPAPERRQVEQALSRIAGEHPSVEALRDAVRRIAPYDAPSVLLVGESGTGKNLVAHAIHEASPRGAGPFIEVSCGAIPAALFENELFGHEPGAFTDARDRKRGLVELADGGTLFLDELEDMPAPAQAKLLRFLEAREVYRLGGTAPIRVDARILVATSREPAELIASGKLREDLYYRIATLPVRLPPLRERASDVALLTASFGADRISAEALAAFEAYHWPGNVRELRNVLERAKLAAAGRPIGREHLPPEVLAPRGPGAGSRLVRQAIPPSGISLDEVEAGLLAEALAAAGGNKSKAARLLSLTRDTLRYRLKKYGLAGRSGPPAGG